MKSIFKAVAVVTIFSIITRLLGFLFRIFLSRKLGAEGLGLFQMASSVLGIFVTLVSSGIPLSTAKLVSKYETNGELKKRNQAVTSALILAVSIAVIASFLIYVLKSVWGIVLADSRAVEILIVLVPSVLFSAIYAVFRGALWGQGDYFNCGLTELIEQVVRFALTFIMLNSVTDYFVATKYSAIAFNITCLVSGLVTIMIYFKKGKLARPKTELKNVFKSAMPITGVRLANSLVQPLTTLIIPTMLIVAGYSTSEAVSSFGVIMGMTFPLLFVPMSVIGSISMVLIPSISALIVKNEYATIQQNITKSIEASFFISMLFIPLYLAVGDLIGIVLYNNVLSGVLLQLSAVCVLPITLCNLTGSVLNALNMEIKSFVNYLFGSIVLFAGLILLTPVLGINSIIISQFLSMSLVTILNVRKIKKVLPDFKFNIIGTTIRYMLIVLPSSILGHFVANICLHFCVNIIAGILGGIVAMLTTLVLCSLFKLYNLSNLIGLIKKKKRT